VVRRSLLVLACLAIVACSNDDPAGPNNIGVSGTVSFSFSGGSSGSFNASGALTSTTQADFTKAWAAGVKSDQDNAIEIAASAPKTSSTHDQVIITIPRTTAGGATINVNCTANTCADVVVTFGNSNASFLQFDLACGLETGTIVVASINSSRVAGTFSGTGTCFTSGNQTSAFTVTNGSFDVALVADVPVS
jgi:hypothetical protein